MKYNVALRGDGCEITLSAVVPLPEGLPPLSGLLVQRPPFRCLDRIEDMLPQFVEELFYLRSETQVLCPEGRHPLSPQKSSGTNPSRVWSRLPPFFTPAKKALGVLPGRLGFSEADDT